MKKLLELRKKLKAKKPTFIRSDAHKKSRVSQKWRKPKGLQNKMRLKKRGYRRVAEIGWGSPKAVKGLHSSGLEPIIVTNVLQLESLTKEQGVVISARVGDRKRAMIIEEAAKKDLQVLNVDPKKRLDKIKQKMEDKKKAQKNRAEKKAQREKKQAKEERKEEPKEDKSVEEKKKEEKKELDKTLTKKV